LGYCGGRNASFSQRSQLNSISTGHLQGTATLSGTNLSIEGEVTFDGPLPAEYPEVYLVATDGPDKELAKQVVNPDDFSYSEISLGTYQFSGTIPNVITPINNGHYEVYMLITCGAEKYHLFVDTASLINKHYFPLIQSSIKLSIPVYAPISQTAHKGTTLTYLVKVTNEGDTEDTINLSVSNQYISQQHLPQDKWWSVEFPPSPVTLLPGDSTDIKLEVRIEEKKCNDITIRGQSLNLNTLPGEVTVRAQNMDVDTLFGVEIDFSAERHEGHTLLFEGPSCAKIAIWGRIVYIVFDPNQPGDLENTYIHITDTVDGDTVADKNLPIKFEQHCDEIIATGFDLAENSYNFSNNGLKGYYCGSYDEGYCYGMSETSILYYEDNKPIYGLAKAKVMEEIAIYQWRWGSSHNLDVTNKNDSKDYECLCERISGNHPMLIMLGTNKHAEHAVVAYKILKDSVRRKSYIFIYNPNNNYSLKKSETLLQAFPVIIYNWDSSTFLPLKFYQKNKTYVYMDALKAEPLGPAGHWGSSWILGRVNECSIEWIKDKVTKIFKCPVNIEITDQYGRIITDIGINEIPGAYCDITDKRMIFYLPADLDYSTKVEAYEKGVFGCAAAYSIETGITEMITFDEDVTVDANTTAQIEGTSMEIDYDGDGVFEKTITGSTDIIYHTELAYEGDLACFCSESATFQALLTTVAGNVLPDRVVTFTLGNQSVAAITDANGIATIELPPSQDPGRYVLKVVFSRDTGDGCYYVRCSESIPFDIYMSGDINQDWVVNSLDLKEFANQWLQPCSDPNWCGGCDIDHSGRVNLADFAIFAENWLWGKIPADIDIDWDVDLADFVYFANHWMNQNCIPPSWCAGADFNANGSVDLYDLAVFAKDWLAKE